METNFKAIELSRGFLKNCMNDLKLEKSIAKYTKDYHPEAFNKSFKNLEWYKDFIGVYLSVLSKYSKPELIEDFSCLLDREVHCKPWVSCLSDFKSSSWDSAASLVGNIMEIFEENIGESPEKLNLVLDTFGSDFIPSAFLEFIRSDMYKKHKNNYLYNFELEISDMEDDLYNNKTVGARDAEVFDKSKNNINYDEVLEISRFLGSKCDGYFNIRLVFVEYNELDYFISDMKNVDSSTNQNEEITSDKTNVDVPSNENEEVTNNETNVDAPSNEDDNLRVVKFLDSLANSFRYYSHQNISITKPIIVSPSHPICDDYLDYMNDNIIVFATFSDSCEEEEFESLERDIKSDELINVWSALSRTREIFR